MSYFNQEETNKRIGKVREILTKKGLDAALIYYDELNIANGWYLTGWCPQFEKGAVLLPLSGDPLLLGGPESEPFDKMSSAIRETRNFSVFMVPDEEYPNATIMDFEKLYEELLMDEEGLQDTENQLIHIGKPIDFDEEKFLNQLEEMKIATNQDIQSIRRMVQEIVPTYVVKNDELKDIHNQI